MSRIVAQAAGSLMTPLALALALACSARSERVVVAEYAGWGPIIVSASAGGRPITLFLDTGSEANVLEPSFKAAGVETRGGRVAAATSGSAPIEYGPAPRGLTVFGVALEKAGDVGYLDLSLFKSGLGRDIAGILGMPLLRAVTLRLDPDAGKAELLLDEPVSAAWGRALPITMEEGDKRPRIKAVVVARDGKRFELSCVLDTGFDTSGMLPAAVFEAAREGQVKPLTDAVSGAAGMADASWARIRELEVGGRSYRGLILDSGKECMLGRQFLARHISIFDFPSARLYLKPGRRMAARDGFDMSGVAVVGPKEKLEVLDLVKDGPGEKAGLFKGDVIRGVEGLDDAAFDVYELRRMFRADAGRKVVLRVSRDGKPKTISFVLKPKKT